MLSSHTGLCRRALAFPGRTGPRHSPRHSPWQERRRPGVRVSASLPPFVLPSDQHVPASLAAASTPPPLLVSLPSSLDAAKFGPWLEAPRLKVGPLEPSNDSASHLHSLTTFLDTSSTESDPTLGFSQYTSYYSVSDSPLLPQTLPLLADASVASNPNRFVLPQGEVPILDAGKVLTPAKAERLAADISALERDTGWRIRILTRFAPGTFDLDEVRAYWRPDARTVVVILDLTSPNILNFKPGNSVLAKLPRQFFIELQSRFGNQFYVAQEGEQTALLETAGVLVSCLSSPEGCVRVPGLSEDLFLLTLGTSVAGGTVFGFALRQDTTEQVTETWQWVLIFSPLWFILFVALGIQPIASRTSDIEPLAKDTLAFLAAAAAIYLTPIFGESPAARWFRKKEQDSD